MHEQLWITGKIGKGNYHCREKDQGKQGENREREECGANTEIVQTVKFN